MAVRIYRGRQRLLVDSLDRRLAGGVDVSDDHGVGVVEAEREGLEQRLEPRIAMRLYDRDHLSFGRVPRGAQHGGDLYGMVAVVVENLRAVPFPCAGESAFDAAERGYRPADRADRRPPL